MSILSLHSLQFGCHSIVRQRRKCSGCYPLLNLSLGLLARFRPAISSSIICKGKPARRLINCATTSPPSSLYVVHQSQEKLPVYYQISLLLFLHHCRKLGPAHSAPPTHVLRTRPKTGPAHYPPIILLVNDQPFSHHSLAWNLEIIRTPSSKSALLGLQSLTTTSSDPSDTLPDCPAKRPRTSLQARTADHSLSCRSSEASYISIAIQTDTFLISQPCVNLNAIYQQPLDSKYLPSRSATAILYILLISQCLRSSFINDPFLLS